MKYEWTEAELAELEDPAYWDWDSAQVVEPQPGEAHHIQLVVPLDRAAIRTLEPAARAAGVSLIDYIRDAAIAYTRAQAAAASADPARPPTR